MTNGKVEIAWESSIHALGGTMAHFTVPIQDPAILKKMGVGTGAE